MKTTFQRYRRCPLAALVQLAVLSAAVHALAVEPTGPKHFAPQFEPWRLAANRITLSPAKPDTGIKTGYVFLYGHYIPPPYNVTVVDCSTYVNGIRVRPELPKPVVPPESLPRVTIPDEPFWRQTKHLDTLALQAYSVYNSALARFGDTALALQAVESTLKADSFVDSVYVSARGVSLRGKPALRRGKPAIPSSFGIWDADPSSAGFDPSPAEGHRMRQRRATELAQIIRDLLSSDVLYVVTWGLEATRQPMRVGQIADVMLDKRLSPGERWLKLIDVGCTSDAYGYVANREQALDEWRLLQKRTRSQR